MNAILAERLPQLRKWISLGTHACLVVVAYCLAYILRFELPLQQEDLIQLFLTLPLILAVRLVVFASFYLYEGLWRYVSMRDILAILKAVSLSSLIFTVVVLLFVDRNFPWPVFLIDWGTCLLFVGGQRLVHRAVWEFRSRGRAGGDKRALVVGAGDAGEQLLREIERNRELNYKIVGFVDDDIRKQGLRIHGIEVLGAVTRLADLCRSLQIEELLIAIPSATGKEMRRIIEACRAAGVGFKTVPSLAEIMESGLSLEKVRRVKIEDLLRREPVRIDTSHVEEFIRGKRVLITGAGGSIGSELCRQVVGYSPESLVMLDKAENGLFFVEMELRDKTPTCDLHSVIGDVTDRGRMRAVFDTYQPHVVFHAAAHKHVPLMEANRAEAVKNNVMGIMVMARAAERARVEHFVMISTDKAVRPSSVMGATKRLAEMYVQALSVEGRTRFVTVRFGNVLASEGSVLQIFQKQIEAGGPVTVTHPEMTRYFMTIPEAAQLVLQAATLGRGGEIFVLDMGEPVRILDLARDLITLSGLAPEKDIGIKITGPRPGEKLFEELLNSETCLLPTEHEKIMVVEAEPVDLKEFEAGVKGLCESAEMNDEAAITEQLTALVPGYTDGRVSTPKAGGRAESILIMENDPYTRTALKRMLQTRYAILEAKDQYEALRLARESRPDLAILNYHLPRTNVERFCGRLREKAERGDGSPRLPIILLIDSPEAIGADEVRALGADGRICRPLSVGVVEKCVERLLGLASEGSRSLPTR